MEGIGGGSLGEQGMGEGGQRNLYDRELTNV